MALINCPNCNNLVSDKAVRCPKCGIDLTPIENIPENDVTAQVENVEPVSQIEAENAGEINFEEDHTLRNVLIGIVVLLAIGGGMWFYYTNSHVVSTSSNLDIAKILEEVDRDMAAKSNDDALNKQNAEKRLEEFKNFRSNDLAAFMLHGKVKKVTSCVGRHYEICEFDESGVLTKYESGDKNNSHEARISHEGNELRIIHAEESGNMLVYKVADYKLIKMEFDGGWYVYSNFDSNNCPLTETCEYDPGLYEDEPTRTQRYIYTDIDEYGNWTTKKDDEGTVYSREIEYYPIQ